MICTIREQISQSLGGLGAMRTLLCLVAGAVLGAMIIYLIGWLLAFKNGNKYMPKEK